MSVVTSERTDVRVESLAKIPTWFGVGGGATRFAKPASMAQLATLLAIDPQLRVLGDGANLLVDDDGVDELVVKLDTGAFRQVTIDSERGLVHVGAGVHLFALMNQTVRAGLGGLEVLAGVPATVGGAIVMNAGGTYGQIADVVERVFVMDRTGAERVLERGEIAFGYRASGLADFIVTGAQLRLVRGEVAALEARKKEINDAKRRTQPMSAHSAGCCFKNPTLMHELMIGGTVVGSVGQRVSAGMLIDRAGLKGLRQGTASVSLQHGNFLVVDDVHTGRARDVIALMSVVQELVRERLGVCLQREVMVWERAGRR